MNQSRLTIRHVTEIDKAAWLEMRRTLWPEDGDDNHSVEIARFLKGDLKNPLAVIISNYDYILDGFEGSADSLEALQDSQIAARRMLRLLMNLVDVACLENGTLEVCASETTLAPVLQSIIAQPA